MSCHDHFSASSPTTLSTLSKEGFYLDSGSDSVDAAAHSPGYLGKLKGIRREYEGLALGTVDEAGDPDGQPLSVSTAAKPLALRPQRFSKTQFVRMHNAQRAGS